MSIKVQLIEVRRRVDADPPGRASHVRMDGSELQAGDAWWEANEHREGRRLVYAGRDADGQIVQRSCEGPCLNWDDCDDPRGHLMVVMPHGWFWSPFGRASNCTMPDDRRHRCWVLHEPSPGLFHVDKAGVTCGAGAGSIVVPASEKRPGGWHGFLHNGELVPC